jgi:Spy/CpxP family protein refolding chaperone
MFGFDLPLWAILLIIAAAIALVAAVLYALYAALQSALAGGGGGTGLPGGGTGTPAPAPPAYAAPLQQIQTLLQTLQSEERGPTADECTQLRDLLSQATNAGAPASVTGPLQTAIDQIC